jgi:hypothetical protein
VSRPRFLTDEDFKQEIVRGVRRLDPSVVLISVRDVGLGGRADPEVLAYAAAHRLIILLHDTNTMTGHAYERVASGREMVGLMLVGQNDPIGPVIESIALVAGASELEDWADRVVFLPI